MSVFLAPQRIRRAVAVAACTVLSTMAAPALGELPGTLITAPLATRDTPIAPTWISVLGATDYEYEFYAGACSAVDLGSPTGTVPAPTTTVNLTPAADGLYCIRVRGVQLGLGLIVVDAGPWAQASVTFDTVPPTAPVITGGQPASQPWLTATFSLATSEPAAKFNWNFGSSQVSNGATAVQNLDAPTGPYTFTVTAKDPAGNVSPASVRVFGLQAPPAPTITSGPPAGSHLVGPPTFTLDGVSGSIRRWSFNPGGAQGVSNTATLSNATETGYTLSATQAFGPRVSAPVTRNFTISSAPPAVGGGVPDGTATKLIPSFGLSGAGSGETYQWVLDGPTAVTGNSSGVDLGQIADGDYTLKARIADSIGNSTAYVTRTFTLDRQKPTVPAVTPDIIAIVNKPPAGTIGGGGEAIISSRWQVDDAAVQVGPSFSTVGLPDGNHTLKAWVTDRAGNESEPLVRAFKLDRLAPNPPDIGPVPGFTNRVPVVTITSVAGQKIQWTLTGPKTLQGEGLSPLQPNFGPLTDGDYTLSATTTSPAGNLSGTSSAAFRLDRVVPVPPKILTKPSSEGGDTDAVFSWQGEPGGSFAWVVSLNGLVVKGPVSTRESSVRLPKLPGGLYTFQVGQTDAAGNPGPLSEAANFAVFTTGTSKIPRIKSTGKPSKSSAKSTKKSVKGLNIKTFGPLFPRAGDVLRLGAGKLRWRYRSGRVAELFNVQIFDDRGLKIFSEFPKGQSLVVPKRLLKADRKYFWQVWPYWGKSRGYAPKPLGVSTFNVTRPRSTRLPAERPPIQRNE